MNFGMQQAVERKLMKNGNSFLKDEDFGRELIFHHHSFMSKFFLGKLLKVRTSLNEFLPKSIIFKDLCVDFIGSHLGKMQL